MALSMGGGLSSGNHFGQKVVTKSKKKKKMDTTFGEHGPWMYSNPIHDAVGYGAWPNGFANPSIQGWMG